MSASRKSRIPASPASTGIPVHAVTEKGYESWLGKQPAPVRSWIASCKFKGSKGNYLMLPAADGGLEAVVSVIGEPAGLWDMASLPTALPEGCYQLTGVQDKESAFRLALGWKLASYHFSRYRAKQQTFASLLEPEGCDIALLQEMADAIFLARDLINTPADDMGPGELSAAVRDVAVRFDATWREIIGADLLKQNYPSIHAIGRASTRDPRLIELAWGKKTHPRVTLVGKGVCFDTGGLDLKPSSGMLLMKKDMGGAATALALAQLIMAMKLPVRLRLLIPAVDNAVSGNAIRPMDIIKTRKGITVEIGNTDAEGRVILCDALAEADTEAPELLIDMATLTGAARTALGPDLPAVFTDDDDLYQGILRHGALWNDPVWRLPLWMGYDDHLKSKTADITNAPDFAYAGAITAALYLKRFVEKAKSWLHIDMMAWNTSTRPGRPYGGEAMTLRALYGYLSERYGR